MDKITILIVVKNEREGIRRTIKSVKQYASEIIVIDGKSTDGTFEEAKKEHVIVLQDDGRGRGSGVRFGLSRARGDIIVLFDGDGSHNPKDIPALILPIQKKSADLVVGSRRTGGSFDRQMDIDSLVRSLGADILTMMVNHAYNSSLTDILYSFRAIRRSIIPSLGLKANGFTIEQEMIISALKHTKRVAEIPSREFARAWGHSKLKTATGVLLFTDLVRQLYL